MLMSWKDITWKVISNSFYGLPIFRFEWQLFFLRCNLGFCSFNLQENKYIFPQKNNMTD